MKTLTIKLMAPLQSYGNEANFERRTSADYPSKSAIIGMIAAALGYSRDDERIQALNQLQFAVRIDQPGKILTDFQTVHVKPGKAPKLTYREYLQDAVFVVAIGGKTSDIDRIKYALKHPRYALFLGRRANAPAGVLQIAEFPDQNPISALEVLPWQASTWYQKRQQAKEMLNIQIVADAKLLSCKETHLVKDLVASFDSRDRQYKFRSTATTQIELRNPLFKEDTQHDALSPL